MKKNTLTYIIFFISISCFATSYQKGENLSNFKNLSSQQVLDTADYYFNKNNFDTALFYYSTLFNIPANDTDVEHQKRIIEAYNKSGNIFLYLGDYSQACNLYIKALLLCEKTNYTSYESKIYNNLGNIYYLFKNLDIAKSYYLKSLQMSQDSVSIGAILNNLGYIEIRNEQHDSAFYYLNESLKICKQHYEEYLNSVWSNMALLYQKLNSYDSAFYYYNLSLQVSKKNNNILKEAENLSQLGALFFEVNNNDSALYYVGLSNFIAEKNNFLNTLANNYLVLSKIEESKGQTKNAFKYYRQYAELRDSLLNNEIFGKINQLQRMYEVAKTNEKIEQFAMEQKINKQKIHYHKIILLITLSVLIFVCGILWVVIIQKRRLNNAYKLLFEKNVELIGFQKNRIENYNEKYKNSALTDDLQDELLHKILTLMEDSSIFCDTDFSVDKLAELVQSNQKYISQVINSVLKKNFRSFLNGYRIREAQLIFSEPDVKRYTIESVALRVGFKSRNAFREAFKEITGVSPNFYLNSMQERDGFSD